MELKEVIFGALPIEMPGVDKKSLAKYIAFQVQIWIKTKQEAGKGFALIEQFKEAIEPLKKPKA